MENDELMHFGKPGMKWGKRKISSLSKPSEPTSDDHNRTMGLKKKKVNTMSNAELRSLNERLQLEKQYKDITKANTSKGKNYVDKVLKTGATVNSLYALYNSPAGKILKDKLMKK